MLVKNRFIVASALAIALSPSVWSQGSPDIAAAPAAAPGAQVQRTLVNLTGELNALQSMIHTIGNLRVNSEDRLNAMNAYMTQKNLMDASRTYAAAATKLPAGTSFADGYKTAVTQEKLRGLPQPDTQDVAALATQVAATTTLAKESWEKQNAIFEQVAVTSAFLQSKNELIGYQQWAPNYAAQQRAANKQRYAAANQKMDAQAQQYSQHLEALAEQWDKQPHGTGLDFNYAFSQGNGPAEGGTGMYANYGNADQGVNPPAGYIGAGGGYYPGAYNHNGYYAGSNYNSYSDTFPDLYGYPAGTDMTAAGFTGSGTHKIWNRSNGNGSSPTPNGNPRGPGGAGNAGGVGGTGGARGAGGTGDDAGRGR